MFFNPCILSMEQLRLPFLVQNILSTLQSYRNWQNILSTLQSNQNRQKILSTL